MLTRLPLSAIECRAWPRKLWHVLHMAGFCLILAAPHLLAQETSPPPVLQPPPTVQLPARFTLIYLSSPTPVLVTLDLKADGAPWPAQTATELLQRLWAALDTDQSGTLSVTERRQGAEVLARELTLPAMSREPFAVQLAAHPRAEMSAGEFLLLGAQTTGNWPVLQGKLRSASRAVELFDLVDQNNDQLLDESELLTLTARLHKLDQDDDESFSIAEVEPFRNPFTNTQARQTNSPSVESWLLCADFVAANLPATERLLTQYDGQSGQPRDLQLQAEELGLLPADLAPADLDHSGGLNAEELAQWLTQPPTAYQMQVELPIKTQRRTRWVWRAPQRPPRTMATPQVVSFGLRELEIKASVPKSAIADNRQFLRLEFRKADADKNDYLNEAEFGLLPGVGAPFATIDVDRDGQIFESELLSFLDQQQQVELSQVTITVERDEKSLFTSLDTNKDRRLSPRELVNPRQILQEFDLNSDGLLARDELQGRLRLSISLRQPELFDPFAIPATMTSGDPIVRTPTEGPEWFRAMDTNRDGEVSEREFLGPWELFERADRDRDGLLSVAEIRVLE